MDLASGCLVRFKPTKGAFGEGLTEQPDLEQTTTTSLLTLPQDLLIEVISELYWLDVIRLRQTCQALYAASKLRSVWCNLLKRVQSWPATRPKLELPIELYSDDELECQTLRFLTSGSCWSNVTGLSGTIRNFPRKTNDMLHLIEGGRWLLMTRRTGSVVYYDLDMAEPEEQVLIPAQYPDCVISITSDLDQEAPILVFRIALGMSWPLPNEYWQGFSEPVLQIWEVSLHLDSSGLCLGLIANKLTSFKRENCRPLESLSLCGNLVSYFEDLFTSDSCVVVRDWTKIKEGSTLDLTPKRIFPLGYDHCCHRLSPGGIIIIVSIEHIQIFDLLEGNEASSGSPISLSTDGHAPPISKSLVNSEQTGKIKSISQPFISKTTNTIRLVMDSFMEIYGLVLPIDMRSSTQSTSPQFIKLRDYPSHPFLYISGYGYHYSMIHHSWPDEPS